MASRDYAADAEEAKTRGNEALAGKDFDKAVQWYTQAIDMVRHVPAPNNKHVYFSNRSAAYLSKGYADSALKDANEAIAAKPDWAKGYTRKAAALHFMKRYDEAEKEYKDALAKFPGDAGLQSGLEAVQADHELAKREGASSAQGLEQLLSHPDSLEKLKADPRTAKLMADPSFQAEFELIKKHPEMLNTLMQSDPRLITVIGVLLGVDVPDADEIERQREEAKKREEADRERRQREEEQRRVEEERRKREAETPEERAARESRERAEAHKERGNAHYKKREFSEALAAYAEAIKEQPTQMSYLLNRASVFLEQGKLQDTLDACDEAIAMGRSNQAPYEQIAKAYERRGNAFLKHDKLPEALAEYKKAQLESRSPAVDEKINKIERALKQKAANEYRDPAKGLEAKERGNAKFKQGDFPGAVADYNEAIKRDPENAVYYVNRAAALSKLLDFGHALEDAEKAIKLDPKYVKAYARRGKIEQLTKKYHRALKSFSQGLEIDPDDAECQEGIRAVNELMIKDNEDPETRAQRAMEDPEIRHIMNDPVIMQVLRDMKEDPNAARKHLSNAGVKAKIDLLIAAGILRVA